jgi:hypothetical protein
MLGEMPRTHQWLGGAAAICNLPDLFHATLLLIDVAASQSSRLRLFDHWMNSAPVRMGSAAGSVKLLE